MDELACLTSVFRKYWIQSCPLLNPRIAQLQWQELFVGKLLSYLIPRFSTRSQTSPVTCTHLAVYATRFAWSISWLFKINLFLFVKIYTGRVPFYQYARDFTVVYHIIQGEKPTMPGRSNPAFRVHGLTDEMCAIMDSCWDIDPYRRPTVKQIILNLPLSDIADLWPVDNWEDRESASRFRNAAYRNDCLSSSVLETVLSWVSVPCVYDSNLCLDVNWMTFVF